MRENKYKSPQELAAQVMSVDNIYFPDSYFEGGETMEAEFFNLRQEVEMLLSQDITDEELNQELERIYQEALGKGIYKPTEGEGATGKIEFVTRVFEGYEYPTEQAKELGMERINKYGYIDRLRYWRKEHEANFRAPLRDYLDGHKLTREEERERIRELLGLVVEQDDLDEEARGKLAADFPTGNFLVHTTNSRQAVKILDSGELLNAKAIYEREKAVAEVEQREVELPHRNSGYEGLSWSVNSISAMPGDRYHITGFVASPEAVLGNNEQLVIPSRPAPFELIQLSGEVNTREFYRWKNQEEIYTAFTIGDSNSVLSNLVMLKLTKERLAGGEEHVKMEDSDILSFLAVRDDNEALALIKDRYWLRSDMTVEIDETLVQQLEDEAIPPGLVWMQGLIDSGRIRDCEAFANCATVRDVVERLDETNSEQLLDQYRLDRDKVKSEVEGEYEMIGEVAVPLDNLYLTVPKKDLSKWIRVLARTKTISRGILVYDDNAVRLENFASSHKGDSDVLTNELRKAISPQLNHTYDYEREILMEDITPDKLTGNRHQVIGEQYLRRSKRLVKINGEVTIAER